RLKNCTKTARDRTHHERRHDRRTRTGPSIYQLGMSKMRYDEVEHGRFPQGWLDLFAGCGRARQRENAGPNDSPDTDASQVERTESALQLAIGRGRFSQ